MAQSARATVEAGLPAPGTYELDPAHSSLGFVARHLMVTKVRGRFTKVSGALHVGDSPEESWAEATIDTASIDSREEQRDGHLRSPDFFDVEKHPEVKFRTTRIESTGGGRFRVEGDLTIKGITRPIVLEAEFEGEAQDPWGGTRIGFTATAEVDREQWGLNWNVALEKGGWLVSKKVDLNIEIQAIRQQ